MIQIPTTRKLNRLAEARPFAPPARRASAHALLLVSALVLAGCLPGSQRDNTRALTPADSLAAAIAEAVPAEDLREVWTTPLGEITPHPTGIAWLRPDSAEARLAVVETQVGGIHLLGADGEVEGMWGVGGETTYPYLAGVLGDTVAVFSRGAERLDWVTAGGVARSLPVPEGATGALVDRRGDRQRVVARVGGGISELPAALVALDASGGEVSRHTIRTGWRASGFVRAWGDSVLALSGYRPVADVLTPGSRAGEALDTLAFAGFDSPLLVRSYQFMAGEVKEPPLLSSASRALGNDLYVLNLRAERVRVDVYGRDGRLRRVLQGPVPTLEDGQPTTLDVYPTDLDVRQTANGLEIAVLLMRARGVLQRADSRVILFRAEAPPTPEPPDA